MESKQTADASEIAKFDAMAEEWWDPNGKFKPLHMLNPCRLDYINAQIRTEFGSEPKSLRPYEGLDLLDIGCGGGLLSEPMARLGAKVTGVDAAARNIPIAPEACGNLRLGYRVSARHGRGACRRRQDVRCRSEHGGR